MIADASAIVPLFADHALNEPARRAISARNLCAPSIMVAETANALWKYAMRDGMTAVDLLESLESVRTMCTIYPDADLMDEAVALALDNRHPVYDCLYLALALERREPLLTADRKLAELALGTGVDAVLLEAG